MHVLDTYYNVPFSTNPEIPFALLTMDPTIIYKPHTKTVVSRNLVHVCVPLVAEPHARRIRNPQP
jgi:hypothetical protein